MRINDRIGWSNFTYNLLYPGILGSMLYDIVRCFREFGLGFNLFLITQISLVILYVLDYLHVYIDLDIDRTQKRAISVAADATLSLMFGFSYWSMTREALRATGIAIFIASVIIFLYPCTKKVGGRLYKVGKTLFVAAAIVLLAITIQKEKYGGWLSSSAVLGVTLVYALHVFVFTEFAKRSMITKKTA
jgi:hypothetical protein